MNAYWFENNDAGSLLVWTLNRLLGRGSVDAAGNAVVSFLVFVHNGKGAIIRKSSS